MRNSPPIDRRTFLKASLATVSGAALGLASDGCAKIPAIVAASSQKLLTVSLTVRGQISQINPISQRQNYYFVVVNLTDNANDAGPVPQIAPPYSNGIAVSDPNFTDAIGMVGFVQYAGGLTDVHLYRGPRDVTASTLTYQRASLTTYTQYLAGDLGLLNTATVSGSTMTATFDLNRLLLDPVTGFATPVLPAYVQVNIITTDYVPSGSATDSPKFWDALGDGRTNKNVYVTLPLAQTGQTLTASQAGTAAEPTDPDVVDRTSTVGTQNDTIDITDWSMRIQ